MKKSVYIPLSLAIWFFLLVSFAPAIVEKLILPPILQKAGYGDYTVAVSRLGLHECTLHISGGPQIMHPLVAGNLTIQWTFAGLGEGRLERISSDSLTINLLGLPLQHGQEEPGGKGASGSFTLPGIVNQVAINHGVLVFQSGGETRYMPFSFSGQLGLDESGDSVSLDARIQSGAGLVTGALILNDAGKKLSGRVEGQLDSALLEQYFSGQLSLLDELGGMLQISGDFVAGLSPLSLEKIDASLSSSDLEVRGNAFSFRAGDMPATLTLAGGGSGYALHGSGFSVTEPVQTGASFDAALELSESGLQWQGGVDLQPEAGPVFIEGLVVDAGQPFRIAHSGFRDERETAVRLTTALAGNGPENPSLVIRFNDITAVMDALSMEGSITIPRQTGGSELKAALTLQGKNGTIAFSQGSVSLPSFGLQSEGKGVPGDHQSAYSAQLDLKDAAISLNTQQVQLAGVQLNLPVAWPPRENGDKGRLELGSIHAGGKNMGNLSASITQTGDQLALNGVMHTPFIPGEQINLEATLMPPGKRDVFAEVAYSVTEAHVAAENLVAAFPALEKIRGNFTLDAQGKLSVSGCGLSGQTELRARNGSLSLRDGGAALEDIALDLSFDDLPQVRSRPRQILTIGAIRQKNVVINNVQTYFHVESGQSLFLEQISGQWGGGRFFTSPFRLQKGQEELEVALFCDRLELSAILSQFNLAEAGGEGRLSGRIPLRFVRGNVYVDDGFLYSSPGSKGNLKIRKSEYLETSVPEDVPQFSPLHFAGAALGDFEYNWARLLLNSEGENLVLQLQVDGRPREKMPFRFDTQRNVFVRLGVGEKGGINQPVKLDVNFNVPLNELFRLKKDFMPLFEQFNRE